MNECTYVSSDEEEISSVMSNENQKSYLNKKSLLFGGSETPHKVSKMFISQANDLSAFTQQNHSQKQKIYIPEYHSKHNEKLNNNYQLNQTETKNFEIEYIDKKITPLKRTKSVNDRYKTSQKSQNPDAISFLIKREKQSKQLSKKIFDVIENTMDLESNCETFIEDSDIFDKKKTGQKIQKQRKGNSIEYMQEYRITNKEKIKGYRKSYYQKYKEKISEYLKEYRSNNKGKKSEYNKEYRCRNKEKVLELNKSYRQRNKDKTQIYNREYRRKNKDKLNASRRQKIRKKNQDEKNKKATTKQTVISNKKPDEKNLRQKAEPKKKRGNSKEYMQKYRSENMEKIREYKKRSYLKNKEKVKTYQKEYRRTHKQQKREYNKTYREKYQEKMRVNSKACQSKKEKVSKVCDKDELQENVDKIEKNQKKTPKNENYQILLSRCLDLQEISDAISINSQD